MGGALLNKNEEFLFIIHKEGRIDFCSFSGKPSELIKKLRSDTYSKPETLRIDVCKNFTKKHSWIIIVKQSDEAKSDIKEQYLLAEDITPRTRDMLHIFNQTYAPFSPYSGQRQMYFLTIGIHNRKQAWLTMVENALTNAGYLDLPHIAIDLEWADDHFRTSATTFSGALSSYLNERFKSPPYILRVARKNSVHLKPGEPDYIYFVIQDKFN